MEHFGSLKERTLERRAEVDPGTINRMYARQGYLYRRKERGGGGGGGGGTGGSGAGVGAAIMSSVSAGVSAMGVQQQWGKCYAQYRAQGRALTIIDYSQQVRISSNKLIKVLLDINVLPCSGKWSNRLHGGGPRDRVRLRGAVRLLRGRGQQVPIHRQRGGLRDGERKTQPCKND